MKNNPFKAIINSFKTGGVILIIILVIVVLNPFVNIEAGHRGIVFDKLRGGVQEQTLTEGLHFRMPLFQTIVQTPIRSQKIRFIDSSNTKLALNQFSSYMSEDVYTQKLGSMQAASSDLQDVYIDATITYHIEADAVAKVYQEVGLDYESKKVIPKIIDAVKTQTAKYKVGDILTKREEIRKKVFESLLADLGEDNIVLEDINLTNFNFNEQFKNAIEQKQIEEQKAQKEEYILQQVEIRSQQRVKEAEANKEAKVLEGEGLSEFNRLIQQEITAEVLEYKRLENAKLAIEGWDGVYPKTYFGGDQTTIPLIPLE